MARRAGESRGVFVHQSFSLECHLRAFLVVLFYRVTNSCALHSANSCSINGSKCVVIVVLVVVVNILWKTRLSRPKSLALCISVYL